MAQPQRPQPALHMERICNWGKRDSGSGVLIREHSDLVGEDISKEDVRLIFPDDVRDEIFETGDERIQTEGAKLPGVLDESVVNRDHLKTIEEPLRVVVVAVAATSLRKYRSRLPGTLSHISEV